MDESDILPWVDANVPQIILLIGGLMALAIAVAYVKDKDSTRYKALMILGVIFGILMAVCVATRHGDWRTVTSVIVILAAFTLIIRPFRDIHFAVIIALLLMALTYIFLGGFNGYILFDQIDLTVISQGWPRIIISFVIGAIFYMIFNFAEEIVKLVGKVMNFWPILAIFGLICIAESVCMFLGYGSIWDYIKGYF
jgi:hypothetical protein